MHRAKARASGDTGALTAVEGMLLHAPVALFALPVPLLVSLALALGGTPRIALLALAWWSLCGAAMMLVDAPARRARYARLLELSLGRGRLARPPALARTVCGLFMSWAFRYRHFAGHRTSAQRGVSK